MYWLKLPRQKSRRLASWPSRCSLRCVKVLHALVEVAAVEVKKIGKLVITGEAMLETRLKA